MPRKKSTGLAGRPVGTTTKLTPAVQERICAALKIGVHAKHAAQREGIPERTFYEWMAKGAEGVEPYHDFAIAVMRANGECACHLVARGLAVGPGAAQAIWMLERRFPKEYGPGILTGQSPDEEARLAAEIRASEQIRACPEASWLMHKAIGVAAGTWPNAASDDSVRAP